MTIRNRPTIQMVAERAGVSRGTVDRVLNNRAHVRPEVYARVMEAIKETGYLPIKQFHQTILQGTNAIPVKLGVLLPNWTGHFRSEILRGIRHAREEFESLNAEILVEECQSDMPQEVLDRIDYLVSEGIQGLSLCSIDTAAVNEKVNQLREQNIPVITFNSDLPDSGRLLFVGQDYPKSGRVAAELISKCIPRDGIVLTAVGSTEFDGHRNRLHGFQKRMRELGFEYRQMPVIETLNDYQITYRKVLEFLEKEPNTNAVYMANRSVAGCTEAIKAAGKRGQIRVICHDMAESTKLLLHEGSVDFTVTQNIFQQGHLPLVLLREYLQKNKVPDASAINTRMSIICSQNMDD